MLKCLLDIDQLDLGDTRDVVDIAPVVVVVHIIFKTSDVASAVADVTGLT